MVKIFYWRIFSAEKDLHENIFEIVQMKLKVFENFRKHLYRARKVKNVTDDPAAIANSGTRFRNYKRSIDRRLEETDPQN